MFFAQSYLCNKRICNKREEHSQLISIILISAVATTNVRVRMLFTVINSKTTEQQEIRTREILIYFVFINKTFCEVFM